MHVQLGEILDLKRQPFPQNPTAISEEQGTKAESWEQKQDTELAQLNTTNQWAAT